MPRHALTAYAQAYLQATSDPRAAVAAFDAYANALRNVPGLRSFVTNAAISAQTRREALTLAVPNQSDTATNLVLLLARDKRVRDLATFSDVLRREAARHHQKTHAVVTSAIPLPAKTLRQLTDILSQRLKQDVWLESHVDPSVIAGLRIQLGDWVFDATRLGRLTRLEQSLMH